MQKSDLTDHSFRKEGEHYTFGDEVKIIDNECDWKVTKTEEKTHIKMLETYWEKY